MTDRELLDAAANAAGYAMHSNDDRAPGAYVVIDGEVHHWNPLVDDGDRYRLARKLKLILDFDGGEVRWYPNFEYQNVVVPRALKFSDNGGEAYAIVRAAAAMVAAPVLAMFALKSTEKPS
jgi:hypothetical protein